MSRKKLVHSLPVVLGTPIKYLLRDDFNDTRAAGSVNGTAATPGGTGGAALNTRTVVDTGNRLSVGSGVVSLGAGGAGAGDPKLWYGSLARAAGQMLLCDMNIQSRCEFGIDSDQTGAGTGRLRYDGTLLRANMPTVSVALEAVSAGQRKVAIVVRATGFYFYAVIGGLWKFIWRDNTSTTNPYFVNIGPYLSGYTAHSSTSIRIPVRKWFPRPAAYDTFTRANGALGNSETTGGDGQAVTARAWTNQLGTVEISGNAAKATALSGDRAIATVPTEKSDVFVSGHLTRGTSTAGIVIRYEDSDNYLYAVHNGTNLQFYKRVAGVETALVDGAITYVVNGDIRINTDGTSAWAYYDRREVGTVQTVPASTFQAHGLIFFDTNSTMDNFRVFPRGTGGEYGHFNRYFV